MYEGFKNRETVGLKTFKISILVVVCGASLECLLGWKTLNTHHAV